jgi:hypothetical protein
MRIETRVMLNRTKTSLRSCRTDFGPKVLPCTHALRQSCRYTVNMVSRTLTSRPHDRTTAREKPADTVASHPIRPCGDQLEILLCPPRL